MPVVANLKPLLVARCNDHQRAAILNHVQNERPQFLTHPRGDLADVDTGGDFHQPTGEVPTEARRDFREHNDDHQSSLE